MPAQSIVAINKIIFENAALLCYYTASGGNSLLTFRGNLSVPSSEVKK